MSFHMRLKQHEVDCMLQVLAEVHYVMDTVLVRYTYLTLSTSLRWSF